MAGPRGKAQNGEGARAGAGGRGGDASVPSGFCVRFPPPPRPRPWGTGHRRVSLVLGDRAGIKLTYVDRSGDSTSQSACDSPSVVPGPAAPTSPWNLLEMQARGTTPGLQAQQLWAWGPEACSPPALGVPLRQPPV